MMRSLWVLLVFGSALCCGVYMYLDGEPTDDSRFIDMVLGSMMGIDRVVPAGSHLGVRRYTNFTMVNPINHYALAPQHISLYEHDRLDTLLVITSSSPGDSVLRAATEGRRVLWENRDSMYHYYITCSP